MSDAGRPPQGQIPRGRRVRGHGRRRQGHRQAKRPAPRRKLPEEKKRTEQAAADLRAGHRGRLAAALHRGVGAGRLLAALHPRQGLPRLQTARLPAGLGAGQCPRAFFSHAPFSGPSRKFAGAAPSAALVQFSPVRKYVEIETREIPCV